MDPLVWWKSVMDTPFALLCPIARMVLAIPATSAAVERAFSNVAYVVDNRPRLSAARAEMFCAIRSYLMSDDFVLDKFLDSIAKMSLSAHQ
jgi:hypothetical protein